MKINQLLPFVVAATVVCSFHTSSNADEHRSTARSFGNGSVTVTSKSINVGPSPYVGQGLPPAMSRTSGVEVQTRAFGSTAWPTDYATATAPSMPRGLGLECACKTVQVRERSTPGLVVLKVKPGSIAAITGIRPDDVLLSVAGQRLSTVSDLSTVVDSQEFCNGAKVLLLRVEQLGKLELRGVPQRMPSWTATMTERMNRGDQWEASLHRQGHALNADQILDLIAGASPQTQQEVCQRLNEKLHPTPVVQESVPAPEKPIPHEMPAPIEPAA